MRQTMEERPEYDFTTTNRVRHTFWVISEAKKVKLLQQHFTEVDSIYIADGHHRSASSALLGKELKQKNKQHSGSEAYNFFMGIFIPESELQIFPFHRLVSSLNGLSTEDFLEKVKTNFELLYVDQPEFTPQKVHEIGMYIDHKWYNLVPKDKIMNTDDPVKLLDVSLLTDHLLSPILGISDLRTDSRIYFLGGQGQIPKLVKEVNSGKARVAFAHFPVTMEQLKTISDADCIMPPKSTWIEPKLRSGLTVYSLKD